MKLTEQLRALNEVPTQVRTMTAVIVAVGLLSIIALIVAVLAVRRAN